MNLFIWKRLGTVAALVSMAASPQGQEQPDAPAGTPLGRCIAVEAKQLDFSGVVSIVQPEGTTTWARGVLDKVRTPEIGAETRFNLGSAGKMFTAVAVAQLVDAGKVRPSDAIGAYVKGLRPEAAGVTVRQLLTHSSGLGNFFSPENLPAIQKARSASDLLPLIAGEKPSDPPGSRFQYSNTGFLLLGILIERISGLSYPRYLDLHVFGPARMTASGLDPGPASTRAVGMTVMPAHASRPAASTVASGTTRLRPGPGEPRGQLPLRAAPEAALQGIPAGGSYSTATDMQRFFAALLGAELTSAAMLKELVSPQIIAAQAKDGSPQLDYGLGFGVGAFHGRRWFGHNGGAPGVNVEAAAYPDDQTTLVVMSNRDPPAASILFRHLRAALFDPDFMKSCAAKLSVAE